MGEGNPVHRPPFSVAFDGGGRRYKLACPVVIKRRPRVPDHVANELSLASHAAARRKLLLTKRDKQRVSKTGRLH